MRVGEMVRELVSSCSSVVHRVRVTAVAAMVESIVRGGRLSPAAIGRVLPGDALPKHGIKRVDRLLGNPKMVGDREHFFRVMAKRLVSGCVRPVVLVDWTHAGGPHEALVAAVPVGGRAVPIYIEAHPLKKLGNVAVEKRFLRVLKTIVPGECRCVIVSDAGFKGPFFQAVLDLGWDFVGRIRGTTKAISSVGEKISKEQFYARASTTPVELGRFGLFVKQRIPCRLVLVRKRRKPGPKLPPPKCKEEREQRQSALDPWLLASSMLDGDAAAIAALYARRMKIEETFRDTKNHRFGWSMGHVRLSTPERTAVLLTLAALAFLVVTLIGMTAERHGIQRRYQANTVKRRVLSFLVLTSAILKKTCLDFCSVDELLAPLATISATVTA